MKKKIAKRSPLKLPVTWECRRYKEGRPDNSWDEPCLGRSPEEAAIVFARSALFQEARNHGEGFDSLIEVRKQNQSRTTKVHLIKVLAVFHIDWLTSVVDQDENTDT